MGDHFARDSVLWISVIASKIIDARTTGQASGSGEEKKRIRVKFDENIYTVINWYFLTVQ